MTDYDSRGLLGLGNIFFDNSNTEYFDTVLANSRKNKRENLVFDFAHGYVLGYELRKDFLCFNLDFDKEIREVVFLGPRQVNMNDERLFLENTLIVDLL